MPNINSPGSYTNRRTDDVTGSGLLASKHDAAKGAAT